MTSVGCLDGWDRVSALDSAACSLCGEQFAVSATGAGEAAVARERLTCDCGEEPGLQGTAGCRSGGRRIMDHDGLAGAVRPLGGG